MQATLPGRADARRLPVVFGGGLSEQRGAGLLAHAVAEAGQAVSGDGLHRYAAQLPIPRERLVSLGEGIDAADLGRLAGP